MWKQVTLPSSCRCRAAFWYVPEVLLGVRSRGRDVASHAETCTNTPQCPTNFCWYGCVISVLVTAISVIVQSLHRCHYSRKNTLLGRTEGKLPRGQPGRAAMWSHMSILGSICSEAGGAEEKGEGGGFGIFTLVLNVHCDPLEFPLDCYSSWCY